MLVFFIMLAGSLNAQQLNDPTKPAVLKSSKMTADTVVVEKPQLVLNGIKTNQVERIAIINQQAYRVGQRIDQDKIVTILSNQVTFSSGKTLTLFNHALVSISTKD